MDPLTQENVKAIHHAHDSWLKEELSGNIAGMLALCSEEILLIPPDSAPVVGKRSLTDLLSAEPVAVRRIEINNLAIHAVTDLAYLTSDYRTVYRGLEPGESTASGQRTWVLRKLSGRWQIAVITWSVESCSQATE